MLVVRAVRVTDCKNLVGLSKKVGTGMTTVSSDPEIVNQRILNSISAFQRSRDDKTSAGYLLVMEDVRKNCKPLLIGMCAIYTQLGKDTPFYSFRVSKLQYTSKSLGKKTEPKTMTLVNDFHGYSEIGTLFLDPEFRQKGRGRFLSFSRFALIATDKQRFGSHLMAEMRGWTDANGNSPFWSAVGSRFFEMEFAEADRLSGVDNHFITELMPRSPIYLNLLPKAAQDVVGITHEFTRPARALLEKQGFRFENRIDIFDGAPCLEARVENIPMIAQAQKGHVKIVTDIWGEPLSMVSNPRPNAFFVALTPMRFCQGDVCELDEESAGALQLADGDPVLICPWQR